MFKTLIPIALILPAALHGSAFYTVTLGSQDFVQFTLPAVQSVGFITSFDTATTTYPLPISQVVFDLAGTAECPIFSGLPTTSACVEVDHTGAQFGSLVSLVSPGVYQSSDGTVSLTIRTTSNAPEPATFGFVATGLVGWFARRKCWPFSKS